MITLENWENKRKMNNSPFELETDKVLYNLQDIHHLFSCATLSVKLIWVVQFVVVVLEIYFENRQIYSHWTTLNRESLLVSN